VAYQRKDFVILACTVLIGLKGVTDGRTDRRTGTSTMAKAREAERKNCKDLRMIRA